MTIKKIAAEKNCRIISTPFDTYTVARLINQSMPISYFMKRENLITFYTDDYIDNILDVMAKKRHRDFPILDNNQNYVGMISRRNLLGAGKKKLILVDHNEKSQAVAGMDEAEILEIIDHHRLGTVETIAPVYFRNQPLGCTATIVYQMYQENNVEIDQKIAGLLCSAILSDTLMFRSPTCTPFDREVAEKLAKIAGIVPQNYAMDMFRAGSNLAAKTEKEIFYQDFKRFTVNDTAFGIGQINSMDHDELEELKARIVPYMEDTISGSGLDMVFFMLTDIMNESSELLFCGDNAVNLIENVYNIKSEKNSVNLAGVVSRKKQVLPAIMEALQQE